MRVTRQYVSRELASGIVDLTAHCPSLMGDCAGLSQESVAMVALTGVTHTAKGSAIDDETIGANMT